MPIKTFLDLDVYKLSRQLAKEILPYQNLKKSKQEIRNK